MSLSAITDSGTAPREECDHDGKCSGMLSFSEGSLRGRIVCEACGTIVRDLGAIAYTLQPARAAAQLAA